MKLQKPPRVHSLQGSRAHMPHAAPLQHPPPRGPHLPHHLPHLVLAAARLSEVGHRGELRVDRLPVKPAVVQVDHGLFRVFLTAKLRRLSGDACGPRFPRQASSHRSKHTVCVRGVRQSEVMSHSKLKNRPS